MDGLTFVLLTIAVSAFLIVSTHVLRAWIAPDRWASENQFRIRSLKLRIASHPFLLTTSPGQVVYRVVVEDAHGVIRPGYLRCGGYLWGMLSDQTEIRWDAPLARGFPILLKKADEHAPHHSEGG